MSKRDDYAKNRELSRYGERWGPVSKKSGLEREHRKTVLDWINENQLGVMAIPNSQNVRESGMLKGAPDLVLLTPAIFCPHCGDVFNLICERHNHIMNYWHVAIELKQPTGRLSPAQKLVHGKMEVVGWIVVVGYGDDDTIEKLTRLYGLGGGHLDIPPSSTIQRIMSKKLEK